MNAVEREPVETRVLNPNASEASYKPKQRSYRKTKLNKNYFYIFFFSGGFCSGDFIREPIKDLSLYNFLGGVERRVEKNEDSRKIISPILNFKNQIFLFKLFSEATN